LPGVVVETYRDRSGKEYLAMFNEPVLVFGASSEELSHTADRARSRDVAFSIFNDDLFSTFNDIDNRKAVAAVDTSNLKLAGMPFRCDRKTADKILKGLKFLN
jgi:hypothetical protein